MINQQGMGKRLRIQRALGAGRYGEVSLDVDKRASGVSVGERSIRVGILGGGVGREMGGRGNGQGGKDNYFIEMRCQIIIDFYQNHKAKGKPYAVAHFAKVGNRQVHRAIARYESSKSYQHQKGSGCPRKVIQREEAGIKKMENKNGSLPKRDHTPHSINLHGSDHFFQSY